jgi:hypothetical protein
MTLLARASGWRILIESQGGWCGMRESHRGWVDSVNISLMGRPRIITTVAGRGDSTSGVPHGGYKSTWSGDGGYVAGVARALGLGKAGVPSGSSTKAA